MVRGRKSSIELAPPSEGSAVVDTDLMATLHTASLAVGLGGLLELSVRDTRAFADAFLKPKSVNRRLCGSASADDPNAARHRHE